MQISHAYEIASKALDFRAVRQNIISSNIANIDTPYYKARDISFENVLMEEANKLYGSTEEELGLAKTNSMHMDLRQTNSLYADFFLRSSHAARNDANTVDLDVETTQMSKNQIMFNATMSAMKKESMIFKSVIDASSKIQ